MQIKRHEPLYLKHRPQALDELVGQAAVTRTLTNAITYDRLSHAYLFTGPRGTGKTSSARILAKSLNCKSFDKATIKPCQTCASCLEIREGISPAVFEIDAASNNSVEDARVLIERAPLVAAGGRYKVYIIDECHMLTKEAFNALLKTIEDPPPNVVFVLATTEEHKVLPTIVSRCQRLMFRLVMQDDLIKHLRAVADSEGIKITDNAVDFLARRSGGGLRDALGLLDQASLLSTPEKPVDVVDLLALLGALHEDVLLQLSDHVLNRRGKELLSSASGLLAEGREPAIIAQEMAKHFLNLAKAAYLSAGSEALTSELQGGVFLGSPEYMEGIYKQAPQFERSELTQLVEALDRLEQACRRSTQPAMHLEVGLLSLCNRHDMLLVRELSERVSRLELALAGQGPLPAPHVVSPSPATAPRPSAPRPIAQPLAPSAPTPAKPEPAANSSRASDNADLNSADEPNADVELSPAPVSAPAQAAPDLNVTLAPAARVVAPDSGDEQEAAPDELDRVWTQTLEELQRRHIPTYSLANVHAIPLSLTDRELVLGTKEAFVKTLEMKSEHIKAAASAVVGRAISLKVRQVNLEAAVRNTAQARPRESAKTAAIAAPQAKQSQSQSDADSDEESEAVYERNAQPEPESQPAAEQAALTSPVGAQPDKPIPAGGANSGILKEAYKLFEGPGSRQIGDKKK
jgi:DNA polymerase-3 subunit gamma/tau